MTEHPTVSCICVSHPSRFGLLQRAILAFCNQRYAPELRELVISVPAKGYRDQVLSFLTDTRLTAASDEDKIGVVVTEGREPIDHFRQALLVSAGEYVAAWDDDDISHPSRLVEMVDYSVKQSCPVALSESLYFFYDTEELFVTNMAQPNGAVVDRCCVSSLVFNRKHFPLNFRTQNKTWTVSLLSNFKDYMFLAGRPDLMIVGCNGDNRRGEEKHRQLASGLPGTWKRDRLLDETNQQWLKEVLEEYGWPFPGDVVVAGKDAQAYQLTPDEGFKLFPKWLDTWKPPENWELRVPGPVYQQLKQAAKDAKGQG